MDGVCTLDTYTWPCGSESKLVSRLFEWSGIQLNCTRRHHLSVVDSVFSSRNIPDVSQSTPDMSTGLVYTPVEEIPQVRRLLLRSEPTSNRTQIHADLRKSFRAGKIKSIEARKTQILQLAYLLKDNYDRFKTTFAQDLGRPPLEVALCAVFSLLRDGR